MIRSRITEFLIALGMVAVLFLVIGFVLPTQRHMSESIGTNRKATIVYDTVNSFRRFKDWSPLLLRDPKLQINLVGPESGKGARVEYSSNQKDIGSGSWEIINSVKNERVEIAIQDATRGYDKVTTFTLKPSGKNNRNIEITQDYNVKYGFNLFGRYAGLYVSRNVGEHLKVGLLRLSNILASVPNVDYRAEMDGKLTVANLRIVDVPAENLLVVNAGNIDRQNDTIKKSIKDNQEWIKRVMDANGLEPSAPIRIVTTDFAQQKYAFDVVQPVRKKVESKPGETKSKTDSKEKKPQKNVVDKDKVVHAATVSADGTLKVAISAGAPVKYVHTKPRRAASASYTGHMAGLDAARNALRAWAVTSGYEVIDRPYESWKGGVDKAFTQEGSYDLYWAVK